MSHFEITGGIPLRGSVRIGGAKNASFKLMIAALLAQSESRLLNFSQISDVDLVGKIIQYLGASVRKAGERAIFINPATLSGSRIDPAHGEQGRFSTMFLPALLHRFGEARVPAPGGDKIGKRPLERHFEGLTALGATMKYENGLFIAKTRGLIGTRYRFEKNTHTGTETLLMAASLAKGKTILENAALEPEIDDLIAYINKMGGKIVRRPGRVIEIEGVKSLQGAIHKLLPDRNEAVSYACAALATKGDVIIENAIASHLKAFLSALDKAGASYEVGDYGIRFYYSKPLKAVDIVTEIEPGFMTDWQPLWATLMTQATGISSIHETIMASRFQYKEDLLQMGAKIESYQPEVGSPSKLYNFNLEDDVPHAEHAIRIAGPTDLKAGEFYVKDLRHGATLVLAAMTASGVSKIVNIDQIQRGYENLDTRLRSMGANIVLVK